MSKGWQFKSLIIFSPFHLLLFLLVPSDIVYGASQKSLSIKTVENYEVKIQLFESDSLVSDLRLVTADQEPVRIEHKSVKHRRNLKFLFSLKPEAENFVTLDAKQFRYSNGTKVLHKQPQLRVRLGKKTHHLISSVEPFEDLRLNIKVTPRELLE